MEIRVHFPLSRRPRAADYAQWHRIEREHGLASLGPGDPSLDPVGVGPVSPYLSDGKLLSRCYSICRPAPSDRFVSRSPRVQYISRMSAAARVTTGAGLFCVD